MSMYAIGRARLASTIAVFLALPGALVAQEQADDNDTVELDEIVVTAHSREYGNTSAKTAFGIDKDLLETPASISVINQDLLKDLQVNNVDEALRNVAGVNRFKTGNGGEEKFTIRGFDVSQSIRKDGARINNGLNVSNIPSTETANIDRIEVLKGPSALLYGEGDPGGVINYITKRPQRTPYSSVEVLVGSDSFYKVEFDTTAPLSDDGAWAYRFVASYEDSESFRDVIVRERLLLNPTINYSGERLGVTLGVEYLDNEYTQDRGQVLDGDLFSGYFYSERLDNEQFFGVPGHNDQTKAESTRIYAIVDYMVSAHWDIEATFATTENDKDLFDSNPTFITPTLGLIGAEGTPLANFVSIVPSLSFGTGETDQVTFKNFFDFDGPGDVNHQILASITYETFETTGEGFVSPDLVFYNLSTGAYGLNDPFTPIDIRDADLSFVPTGASVRQDFDEFGINLLDSITFNDEWSVLVGLRYSDYEDNLSDFDDDDLSFRGGVVYSPMEDLSLYLSYSEGYSSSGGALGLDDQPIDPETSDSWELGAKWSLVDDQLLLTAVLYSIEQKGVAFLANPLDPPADQRFGNIGAFESQGFEFEAVGRINENWRIQGGYSYIDNEVTEGGSSGIFGPIEFSFEEGNRLPGIAEHNFNIATFYEIPLGDGVLGLGGGAFYQGDTFASGENNLEYDSWVQVDLAGYYRWGQWKAQLNVRNAFDEDYRLTQVGVTPDIFAAIRVGTSQSRALLASIA